MLDFGGRVGCWWKIRMTNKKLFILRGLPGSGKSEKAKKLVGNGKIHSTDEFHIKNGKYVLDVGNLSKFHHLNLIASIESMKKGITPVIIDNTNIIASHCKKYVEAGKMYGYEVIIIEPTAIWAFNIEELTKRNVHGVSRDTIIEMLRQYESPEVFKRKLGIENGRSDDKM